jgi:hypothetical protein
MLTSTAATSALILAPYLRNPDFSELLWNGNYTPPAVWLVLDSKDVAQCWNDMDLPAHPIPTMQDLANIMVSNKIPYIFARVQQPETRPTIDAFYIHTADENVIDEIQNSLPFIGELGSNWSFMQAE